MSKSTRMLAKRHTLLAELKDVIGAQLRELDVAEDAAEVIGSSVIDYLCNYWAGQVVTFPKDANYTLTLKELEIYDQFHGDNGDDLARRYGMTPRGMRKLIARIRGKIRAQAKENAIAGQLDLLGG